MKLLLFIESLALVTALWFQWRRSRSDTPRTARAFWFFVLAVALYTAVNAGANGVFHHADPGRSEVTAALILFALQVLRTLFVMWAVRSWLDVTRPRLVRSWRGVLILICLVFIALVPDSSVAFGIVMLLPLSRLKWTENVHGWGRAGLVVAFGVITLALTSGFGVHVSTGLDATFGPGGGIRVEGEIPRLAGALVTLSRPWEHVTRTLLVLVRLSVMLAFLQLLVVPIRLRGLSIKRRFTVTLAMYRFIPGTLGLVFMVLLTYLAIGLHRASLVSNTFDATLDQALPAAAEGLRGGGTPHVPASIADEERAFAVVRSLDWTASSDDSTDSAGWTERGHAASTGTPPALAALNAFRDIPADTARGLVECGGNLYLRAATLHRQGDRATGSEVFVDVDSTYLARIGKKIHSDIEVDITPNLFLGETEIRIEGKGDTGWADSAYTISAPFATTAPGDGLPDKRVYLARTFIPMGNWLEPLSENRVGGVQLKLYSTPRMLVESITDYDNTTALASQLFAIMILAAIALLFFIVELSAVRTGRSIVKGIVTDVHTLTDAAARFGKGDLSHRVDLSGDDEMGQLASTFNGMAQSIEQNQELLLEKQRIEADLSVARDIQQRMLPQSPPSVPGLDVAGLSIPSREVGGDLFYFLPVAEGRLGITIGDVSGKSVPAALLMSNVLAALRSEARIVDREDEILGHLNRLIVEQVEPGRFVTFFYGVVDPRRGLLRYACAGHNPPLLIRASGDAEWLTEAGVPLGVVAHSVYSPYEVTLAPGDVLVLYSDGVTEAQREPVSAPPEDDGDGEAQVADHDFFDEHRLETAVRDSREKSAAAIVADIMQAVRDFTDGAEASDDLTLVVVRLTSPGLSS